jgi:gamma-glutamyltranspeptidase/glutathione hydrolase
MVAAANPLAVNAGYSMLLQGGSAADAAIAVQLVLGLVEAQSSGIGGGAFMLFHDAKRNKLIAYDGRETAPAAAKPERFLDSSGQAARVLLGGRRRKIGWRAGNGRAARGVHKRHGSCRGRSFSSRRSISPNTASSCPSASTSWR